MEKNNTRSAKRWTTTDVTRMELVTGLYVAVTLVLSVFSFGVIQIRLSEMFNYLSLYNKRYIVAVTAGVALANIASPLGLIDVVVGSVSTLLVLLINYKITSRIKNMKVKNSSDSMRICFFHAYSSWSANDFISTTFFLELVGDCFRRIGINDCRWDNYLLDR